MSQGWVCRFGSYELDTRVHELRRDGTEVAVEPQVFDVLAHLIEHRDRTVPKEELLDSIWGTRFVTESTLTSRIKAARKAVGDDGRTQAVIRTVHGRGYRFVADATLDEGAEQKPAGPVEPSATFSQEIRFCQAADGAQLAYAQTGTGPPLVKAANWMTHLDYDWESPAWRHLLHGLSTNHTLIRYDERGCGLSDRDTDRFDVEAWVTDLETVVDTIGLERFPLLGISQGGAVAIEYAARHPERVSHLVLYGAYAIGIKVRARRREHIELAEMLPNLVRFGWGRNDPSFRRIFSSQFISSDDPAVWEAFDELQLRSCSPENAARFMETFNTLDVMDRARDVEAPTLILHARGDRVAPLPEGRRIATLMPQARLVTLETDSHILLEGDPAWDRFVTELEAFLASDG